MVRTDFVTYAALQTFSHSGTFVKFDVLRSDSSAFIKLLLVVEAIKITKCFLKNHFESC